MPWIACDVTLPREPKTLKLAMAMGWNPKETVGYLLTLWGWCLDFAPDGDLSGFTHDLIADAIGLPAVEGDRLVEALVKSRWADGKPYLRMHDWWSLVGIFLKGRYSKEPWRWKRIQRSYGAGTPKRTGGAASSRSGAGPNLATTGSGAGLEQVRTTVHNRTIHNSTEHPPLHPPCEGKSSCEDEDDGLKKATEDIRTLKREITRRSGIRRFSQTDEQRLIELLGCHGERTIEACRHLHGGIKNVPAYLSVVLEEKDDTTELIRQAQAILKKGEGA
jgi:hypothetical protein